MNKEKVIAYWDYCFENGEQIHKFYCPDCYKKADIKRDTIKCYKYIGTDRTQKTKCESCGESLPNTH